MMWNNYHGMMNGFCGFGTTGGIIMGIIFLVILGIIIYFAVIALRKNTVNNEKVTETALDILKKKYAKGEITKEEFEEKKKTIS